MSASIRFLFVFPTDAFHGYVVFVVMVVVLPLSGANLDYWLHFTWQLTLWASEAFIRKVQPENVFFDKLYEPRDYRSFNCCAETPFGLTVRVEWFLWFRELISLASQIWVSFSFEMSKNLGLRTIWTTI